MHQGFWASTASVYFLLAYQVRDSGLPADVLVGKLKRTSRLLKKDISFALRRGTISQVTTAFDAAQRAVEDELALDEASWDRSKASSSSFHQRRRFGPFHTF